MAARRLDNASWGFESKCFVCDSSNDRGLGISFFHDDEAAVVHAEYVLDETYSGAPSYVHGGVTLAILDEAMAWAAIALAGAFALTRTTTATFLRPVRVGRRYRVEARMVEATMVEATVADGADAADGAEADRGWLAVRAVVRDERARTCVEAQAHFVPMSRAQARVALGADPTGPDAGFVRGGPG